MIGMFRAGGFQVNLTHHVMHTIGSRVRDGVASDYPGEPVRAALEEASLGRIIDVDQPEAEAISLGPFKVVHQRPNEVRLQGDTLVDGAGRGPEMFRKILDSFGI